MNRWRSWALSIVLPFVVLAMMLTVWQLVVTWANIPALILPGPSRILSVAVERRHELWSATRLTAAAARKHDGIAFLVTAPLGLHPLMSRVVRERIEHCLRQAAGKAEACDVCESDTRCRFG